MSFQCWQFLKSTNQQNGFLLCMHHMGFSWHFYLSDIWFMSYEVLVFYCMEWFSWNMIPFYSIIATGRLTLAWTANCCRDWTCGLFWCLDGLSILCFPPLGANTRRTGRMDIKHPSTQSRKKWWQYLLSCGTTMGLYCVIWRRLV